MSQRKFAWMKINAGGNHEEMRNKDIDLEWPRPVAIYVVRAATARCFSRKIANCVKANFMDRSTDCNSYSFSYIVHPEHTRHSCIHARIEIKVETLWYTIDECLYRCTRIVIRIECNVISKSKNHLGM